MEGFIGWVGIIIGHRMLTVTACESPDNPRQLLRGGPHQEAMSRFFGPELADGGMISVWIAARIGILWVRCPACARMLDSAKAEANASVARRCRRRCRIGRLLALG